MPTILVTGGAGFIGSHFVDQMLAEYDDLRIVDVDALTYAGSIHNLRDVWDDPRHLFVRADICDVDAMRAVFEEYVPTAVVNFAAQTHVDRSIASPMAFVETNVMGTARLLECARRAWETSDGSYPDDVRFVQVSTDEVYGSLPLDSFAQPFTEESPLAPNSPYAASKASADCLVHAWGATYGMPVIVTRSSNNYGLRQHTEKLIPLVIECARRHEPIPIYGDGLNVRDWLWVGDNCAGIRAALEIGRPGEAYNLASGDGRANIDVVRSVLEALRDQTGDPAVGESLIVYVPDRRSHDLRYSLDTSKAARELGWCPKTPFEEGIAHTVEWYLAQG